MEKQYLECGRIVGVHGVRGAVKVESWCDTPAVLTKLKQVYIARKGGDMEELKVSGAFVNGSAAVLTIDGINTREDAVAMRGTVLHIHRSQITLKPGEMFVADMIGLPVIHADSGERLGTVSEVNDGVQGKLYTISTDKGEVIYPSGKEFVRSCSLEGGLVITPIPGFFD